MTSTCLPPAAYYHINRNTEPVKPRFREPLPTAFQIPHEVATQRELEAAFRLCFGQQALEEDFPCVDWASSPLEWEGDARKFAAAFEAADGFVWSVMHRLYPYQQKEMIPALTHALMSWSERRETPIPTPLDEEKAINLLNWSSYGDIADWLKQQQ
jgi:hypothetical protein